jgi:hypothetical protein
VNLGVSARNSDSNESGDGGELHDCSCVLSLRLVSKEKVVCIKGVFCVEEYLNGCVGVRIILVLGSGHRVFTDLGT